MPAPIDLAIRNEAVARYLSGESAYSIARDLGVSNVGVLNWVRSEGHKPRDMKESKRRLSLDEEVFSSLNEHSEYWAGFIAADGCIHKRKGSSDAITVALAPIDNGHLVKLKSFLKSEHKISYGRYEYPSNPKYKPSSGRCSLSVKSDKISADLDSLGITERKTFSKIPVASCLASSRHFWRGMIDGDGSVTIHAGYARLTLCGTEAFMQQFCDFLEKNKVLGKRPLHPCLNSTKSVYTVQMMGSTAERAIELLYEDCDVALDRKLAKAQEILA